MPRDESGEPPDAILAHAYTRFVTQDDLDGEQPVIIEDSGGDDEDEYAVEPRSLWSSAAEIGSGLLALVLVTIAVWVVYLAFGLGFALVDRLLTIAAPALLAMGAAVLLARYLSRR